MAMGPMIKKFRNIRGMTQAELGKETDLNDTRIRHYELDIRTPKEDIASKIATALKINKEYLNEANYPYDVEDVMRILFKIDDNSNLKINKVKVDSNTEENADSNKEKYAIYFEGSSSDEKLNEFIELWMKKKKSYDNEEVNFEEYEDWKANFPESTYKDYKPTLINKENNK